MTNIVQGWVSGTYSNYSFLIKLDNEGGTYRGGVFPSREYAEDFAQDMAFAPKLEITYNVAKIESCSVVGDPKDLFNVGDTVYVTGSRYAPSTTYNFYIVSDEGAWVDGQAIPQRLPNTVTAISSDNDGNILPIAVWSNASTVGQYDIVVDVNGNGHIDAGIDAVDDNDIEVTAIIVPEFPASLFVPLFMLVTVLAIVVAKKRSSQLLRILHHPSEPQNTPHTHVLSHNQAVSRNGFCGSCKRTRSPYEAVIVERGKA